MTRQHPDGNNRQDAGLAALLREKITAEGPISVADYMELCLAHPTHGYYMTRDPFGTRGDFTTAPEISQVFGEVIGAFLLENWREMGAPEKTALVELGPGRGSLTADIWRIAEKAAPDFCAQATVHLVEISPVLKERQRETLAHLDGKISWHDSLDDLPQDRVLIVMANEFFDALPIRQFIMEKGAWRERGVTTGQNTTGQSNGFAFTLLAEKPEMDLPKRVKDGAVFEYCPAAEAIMQKLATRIKTQRGFALVIDYGHADEWAIGDTLQALSAHQHADPLWDPGERDITAHVNFAVLRNAVRAAGVYATDVMTQGDFLRGIGIEDYADNLRRQATPEQAKNLILAVQRLTASSEMGRLFKVMGLSA